MNPERWVEVVVLVVGMVGGAVVWIFNVESRLRVLERVFSDHVKDKAEALKELKQDMHEIKATLEVLSRRCIAFRHYERTHATLAGELGEVEEEAGP